MLVILLIGTFAILATGVGLLLSRRGAAKFRQTPAAAAPARMSPRKNSMMDLFSARLRSGAIGIPDLIRLLRKEGNAQQDVSVALHEAMQKFPQFAQRKDKFESWLKEADRQG